MEEQFAVLRALLNESPSSAGVELDDLWLRIKDCLNQWPADTVGTVAVDYLRSHMQSEAWPEEYLEALERWAPVRWDAYPKMKRRVYARRGSHHNPKSLKKRPKAMSVADYRDTWREPVLKAGGWMRNYYPYLTEDRCHPIYDAMMETWAEGADVSDGLDVDVEALAYSVLLQDNVKIFGKENLVTHWCQVEGPAFALSVMVRLRQPPLTGRFDNYIGAPLGVTFSEPESEASVALRRFLVSVSDEEYADTMAHAETLLEDADLFSRCAIAFVFPERTDWGTRALEGCLEACEGDHYATYESLMLSAFATRGEIGLRLAIVEKRDFGLYKTQNYLFSMLDVIGSDAFTALKELYQKRWWRYSIYIAEALALIESQEVAQLFARCLDKWTQDAPDVETTYLKAHPGWARPALEAVIAENEAEGTESPRAVALLGVLEAQQEIIVKEVHQEGLFVDRSSLPRGLGAPPWHDEAPAKKKKGKKSKKANVEMLPYQPSFVMSDAERQDHLDERQKTANQRSAKEDAKLLDEWAAKHEADEYFWLDPSNLTDDGCRALLSRLPPEFVWDRLDLSWYMTPVLIALTDPNHVEDHTEAALEAYFAMVRQCDKKALSRSMKYLDDAALAVTIAEMAGTKTHRSDAVHWLSTFPEAAAVGLIPAILNTTGKKKKATYEAALQLAMEKGDRAIVEDVAGRYGDDVVEALTSLDPYQLYPKKMPKMPFFWSPSSYTPLRLKDAPGLCLPMEVIEDVGLMLKFSSNSPYIGLRELQDVVDPIALDRWSWELFSSWVKGECPMDEIWPMAALAMFGQGTMLRELPLLMDQWYSTGHHQRGWRLMDIFQEFATPWTILALGHLYKSALHPYVGSDVWSRIDKLDESLELDRIVDQAVPRLGWSEDGGPKITPATGSAIQVSFDPTGVAVLRDGDGLIMYDLPESIAADDPCRVVWETIKQQVDWLAPQLYLELETAMRQGRRWSQEAWEEDWLGHPLLKEMATSLVWGFYKSEKSELPTSTFLVDADGALQNAAGKSVSWPKKPIIGLPHPLALGKDTEKQRLAWQKKLRKEGIEQHLPQIDRPTFALTEKEIDERLIKRWTGKDFDMTHSALLGRSRWSIDKRAWRQITLLNLPLAVVKGKTTQRFQLQLQKGFPANDYLLGEAATMGDLSTSRGDLKLQPAAWISELIYDFERICS